MKLYGYQESALWAALAGHRLIADSPGLGKTAPAIAAHAILRTTRLVVVCPPVAVTNWIRELTDLWGYAHLPGEEPARASQAEAVMVVASWKVPPFPNIGVVVVPDALLAARPQLADDVCDWLTGVPERSRGVIVDESHRFISWTSQRSLVTRRVAHTVGTGLRLALSGSSVLNNVSELTSQLDITGHLTEVFGGLDSFLTTYCRLDNYGKWVSRVRELPKLRAILDQSVWVLRGDEVFDGQDMPDVISRVSLVDVDLTEYLGELKAQQGRIRAWAHELGHPPTDAEIADYAVGAIEFISPLRKAAGLAKVDAAISYLQQWVASHDNSEPLIVWCHHQEVQKAVYAAAVAALGKAKVGRLTGGQTATARGDVVTQFQAGQIQVLVASIAAAGVAVTLTRGRANLVVEADWTPGVMDQMIRRTKRIGQKRNVLLTTLIAAGTIDEHIQRVQSRKAINLNELTGRDNDTSVMGDDGVTIREIVSDLVRAALTSSTTEPVRRVAKLAVVP